jgi:hypothetical protein
MKGPDDPGAIVVPFFHAWVEALQEWDWQGRTTLELNLHAFNVRYNEWHGDGCPDPAAWIEAKLATMLHEQRPHALAIQSTHGTRPSLRSKVRTERARAS